MRTFVDIDARRERMIALNKSRAIPVEDRLWSRAELTGDCFIWTGVIGEGGYGGVQISGKRHLVHRVSYNLVIGPVPHGLVLDHLCRNRACINPTHLEAVTMKENTNRGIRANSEKTHCKRGHEFTPENTRTNASGSRSCRRCQADKNYKGLKSRYKYKEQFNA